MSDAQQELSLKHKLEEIKDWWIGDNTDWQEHFDNKRIVDWVRRDIVVLFNALDQLTLENAKLEDALRLLYNKIEETSKSVGKEIT